MTTENEMIIDKTGNVVLQGVTADGEFKEIIVNSDGSTAVSIQDQTTELVDLYVSRNIQDISIVTNTVIDQTVVTISTSIEPTDGNIICFKEGQAFYQGEILSHVVNGSNRDITLDTPLDYAFTTNGGCDERSLNMNVDGSVTPVVFDIGPAGGGALDTIEWDIVRVLFSIESAGEPDGIKFGDIAGGITKGIVLRKVNGITKNIFNVKSNGQFADRCYDVAYDDRSGPQSDYFTRIKRTFGGQNKNGVVVRLDAEDSATLQVIVQDDLTQLLDFRCIVQGHLTDNFA